jgi:hypothetical protein
MDSLGVPLLNVLGWIFLAIAATVIGLIVRRYAWAWVQGIRIGWLRFCTLLLPPDERARSIAQVRSYLAEQFAEQRANGASPPEIAVDILITDVLIKGLKDAPADVGGLASRAADRALLGLLSIAMQRRFLARWPTLPFRVALAFLFFLSMLVTNNASHQLGIQAADAGRVIESASIVKTTVVH